MTKTPRRPKSDDDGFWDHPMVMPHLTVFELDPLPPIVSPIVQPNGDPIIYYPIEEGQGFIGFLKPSWIDEEDEEEEEEDDDADAE